MDDDRDCIAFFDSGIGGLTLLRECAANLPDEKFVYLGDNARAPYGNKSAEEIKTLTAQAFAYLARFPLKAAVVACNTVTADCIGFLRERFSFPILGVEPAVKPAAKRGGSVLVLSTAATASSARFQALLDRWSGAARLIPYSPTSLAGEIEKNISDLSRLDLSVLLPKMQCDAVVLGCTHYIFVKKRIEDFYGCRAYDGNAGTAARLAATVGAASAGRAKNFAREEKISKENFVGKSADLISKNTNKCSILRKNGKKTVVLFVGESAEKNKSVFESLF